MSMYSSRHVSGPTRLDWLCLCCPGNKEEEEVLMREWFSVLNRKNDFIKRQMELQIL